MIRKVSTVLLVGALAATSLPDPAFADQNASSVVVQASAGAPASHPLDLRNATRGITLARQTRAQQSSRPFMGSTAGKATVAVVAVAAALLVGYAVSQGPDPTPANTK